MATNDGDLPDYLKDAPPHVIARYIAGQVASSDIEDPEERMQAAQDFEDDIKMRSEEEGQ